MNEKFVKEIMRPRKEELRKLRDKAVDLLRSDGNEKWSLKKSIPREKVNSLGNNELCRFAFTFYYDWERDEKPDYMFLVQNPGKFKKDRNEPRRILKNIEKNKPLIDLVRINRRYLTPWLLKDNKNFSEKFFSVLHKRGFIKKRSSFLDKDKLKKVFFRKFYLTDLVKYRVKTEDIEDKGGGNASKSFDEFLSREIDFLKPKVLFSFGVRCWKTIYRNLSPDILEGQGKGISNIKAVTDVHGIPFKCEEMFILPLAHFSQRNHFLRDSYYDYLSRGLEQISEKMS